MLRTAILVLALVAACTSGQSTSAPSTVPSTSKASPTQAMKVLTFVEENHGFAAARRQMPFLTSLADTYGEALDYHGLTHPSLPNYLGLAGGSTFAVHDDGSPAVHPLTGSSVFDLGSSQVYVEAMGRICQTRSAGRYAVKHNPWAYFVDPVTRRGCRGHDVPSGTTTSGALLDDIRRGTLPQVGLVIPDLCHDAHDCPLATADQWLKQWWDVISAGPDWRSGRLAVVVTFDEARGFSSERLLTVVASPRLHHMQVTTPLDHLSWCRWMTDLVGARPLRQAAGATSLGGAFGLSR